MRRSVFNIPPRFVRKVVPPVVILPPCEAHPCASGTCYYGDQFSLSSGSPVLTDGIWYMPNTSSIGFSPDASSVVQLVVYIEESGTGNSLKVKDYMGTDIGTFSGLSSGDTGWRTCTLDWTDDLGSIIFDGTDYMYISAVCVIT